MKKASGFLAAALALASLAFIGPKTETKTINVVLDAGHGGKDFGMTQDDYTEKQLVASLTEKIQELNRDRNVQIHLTRKGDAFMALEDRVALVNQIKPDLVLSLHVNGNKNPETSGLELYVPDAALAHSEKSRQIATLIEQQLVAQNLKSRGIKPAPFQMLKKTEVPAIVLELGYLSNPGDRQYLTDEKQQQAIAKAIFEAVTKIE